MLVAMTDDLVIVITVKHLLGELNVYNVGDGRADHSLQADFFKDSVIFFINEFINSNDGNESDSTYRTKMQQLIDDVLSYEPPLRVYNSTRTATLTLKMRDEDTSTEDIWMRTTKIPGEDTVVYKQWIKPENDLNDMFGKKWKGQPIGNSPEVMPLDTCLFQDVNEEEQYWW